MFRNNLSHVYAWLLVTPALILMGLFTHIPSFTTLVSSFFSTGTKKFPSQFIGLENYELAEKIILAFLQSANQGIELIQYHPDEATASVLRDIFTTLRDDIKKLMQAEDATGVNPHPGLKQHELLDYVLDELSGWQIFHNAGWENWMPDPKEAEKVMVQFRSDAYKTFTNHWFKDLPEEKQQEWIDWVGGDL